MKNHVVVISVETDIPHPEVQSWVLQAVREKFDSQMADRGPVSVTGIDILQREAEKARLTEERDEYRKAWLAEKAEKDEILQSLRNVSR